jgi:hypothetical protein
LGTSPLVGSSTTATGCGQADRRQVMSGRVVVGFSPTPAGYEALRYAVETAMR